MPIIDMKKVFLLGHEQEKDKIFEILQNMGNIQLLDIKNSESWQNFESLLEPDCAGEEAGNLDYLLGEIRYCLDLFQRHFPVRKNFVQQFVGGKMELTPDEYSRHISSLDQVNLIHDQCRQVEEKLIHYRNEETQHYSLIEELTPWLPLKVPLENLTVGPHAAMGLYQVLNEQYPELEASLRENLEAVYLEDVSSNNEYTYFFLACLTKELPAVREICKDKSANSVTFSDLEGTPEANAKILQAEAEKASAEQQAAIKELEELLAHRTMLMACHDHISNELKKHEAVSNLVRTEKSFLLEGWVPVPVLSSLEQKIATETETAVMKSRDPEPGEDIPILLHNSGPVEAYEVVTKLYSTPKKNELDPTPFLAPFFFVFFGICLSDAGYGVILALMALFISRKLKLGGMGKQLIQLLFFGGISSVIFGILFGGYFGDFFKLPPLWFNPLEDPMQMLIYCFALGLIHIYFGMGLQAYRNIKARQPLNALFDQGSWFIFLNGLIMLLLPQFSAVGKWLAIGGAAALILTQGRTQQGIIKKLMSGLVSLYNITGYLSDVLSYSRLLALGLATGVIATAINSMGDMVAGSIVGTIIMIGVLLIGHLFNIIISTLSSYVHTSRLQYIEFFSKFFEGGGSSFQPFGIKREYIDLAETEESHS
ncbi:MAG: V-type ATP synthase subunit I [Bacillota bacterium]|nr:V-type ATP synthase subunit I [Bacillota bacterium]